MAARSTFMRSFGIALLATSVLSCALVMSFDDYDLSPTVSTPPAYGLRGTIEGLEGNDASVALAVNGAPALSFPNGTFAVAADLAEGASFEVKADSPLHVCSANPPNGRVSGEIDVRVRCDSANSKLRSLISVGASVLPVFESGNTKYGLSVPLLATLISPVRLTAIADSPTAVLEARTRSDAGAQPLASGMPFTVPSEFIVDGFELTVKSRAGTSTGYSFVAPPSPVYFKASNTRADDAGPHFGTAVALDADTLAIGAPYEDNAGAVYVFRRTSAGWAQEAYVKAASPSVGANFGGAIALSGDTLVVGAIGDSNSAGAAYVFQRVGITWSEEAKLQTSTPNPNAYLGSAVAIEGDTLIVGARAENAATGAAYVFRRSSATWTQEARLTAANARNVSFFGASVAVNGDYAVVGAPEESSGATGVNGAEADTSAARAGAAYVFRRDGFTWTQEAYLKASNTRAHALFGGSVALGKDAVVVGSSDESTDASGIAGAATQAGAAYVFRRDASTWTQQAYLKASNPRTRAFFGSSVALSGDTIVVGSSKESSDAIGLNGDQSATSAFGAGAAYVFRRRGDQWSPLAYVKASNTRAGAEFGASVALSGDTLLVGSPVESSVGTGVNGVQGGSVAAGRGAAYLY